MKFIDIKCGKCGAIVIDHLMRDVDNELPYCHEVLEDYPGHGQMLVCQTKMERVYLPTGRGTVIDDSIPGGTLIYNGLCNADGTPARYFSKSAIAAEAKKRGLLNYVVHSGTKSGDKSKHTVRWT